MKRNRYYREGYKAGLESNDSYSRPSTGRKAVVWQMGYEDGRSDRRRQYEIIKLLVQADIDRAVDRIKNYSIKPLERQVEELEDAVKPLPPASETDKAVPELVIEALEGIGTHTRYDEARAICRRAARLIRELSEPQS